MLWTHILLINIKLDEFLPFCIIWALEQPDSSTKPSEQYTIGYPDTWAFPSTKFESLNLIKREIQMNFVIIINSLYLLNL